jgi:hypothetical protein
VGSVKVAKSTALDVHLSIDSCVTHRYGSWYDGRTDLPMTVRSIMTILRGISCRGRVLQLLFPYRGRLGQISGREPWLGVRKIGRFYPC